MFHRYGSSELTSERQREMVRRGAERRLDRCPAIAYKSPTRDITTGQAPADAVQLDQGELKELANGHRRDNAT